MVAVRNSARLAEQWPVEIFEVIKRISNSDRPWKEWCCCITTDPEQALVQLHGKREGSVWLQLESNSQAQAVQALICDEFGATKSKAVGWQNGRFILCFQMNMSMKLRV